MRLRVRSACIDQSGPVVTVIRQPRGPSDDKVTDPKNKFKPRLATDIFVIVSLS